jgi:hypothetical protein
MQALSQEFEQKLRFQIATAPPRAPPLPFVETKAKDGLSRFREHGQPLGRFWNHMSMFGDDLGKNISLADGPTMWLRLIPTVNPGKRWPPHELKQQARTGGGVYLLPFLDYPVFDLRAEDGMGACSLNSKDELQTVSAAFAFETGEVWSIDTWLLASDPIRLFAGEIERLFSRRLKAYAHFLGSLGVGPPYRWIAGLEGVKGRRLQIPPPQGRMQIGLGPECMSDVIFEEGVYDGGGTPSKALNPFFSAIYNKSGIPRPDYLPS